MICSWSRDLQAHTHTYIYINILEMWKFIQELKSLNVLKTKMILKNGTNVPYKGYKS